MASKLVCFQLVGLLVIKISLPLLWKVALKYLVCTKYYRLSCCGCGYRRAVAVLCWDLVWHLGAGKVKDGLVVTSVFIEARVEALFIGNRLAPSEPHLAVVLLGLRVVLLNDLGHARGLVVL